MRFDVVTLFPEMLAPTLALGVVGRALAGGELVVRCKSPRDFGIGRHRSVDDTPYGGGAGMVMRVDCLVACMEALDAEPWPAPDPAATGPVPAAAPARAHRVLLSPQGARLDQRRVAALGARPAVMLVCGRYEGFDERVRDHVDEELSLGDFVLSGGELAALCVIDACARLLPGVLGNAASLAEESHSPSNAGLLEYPQYTRPAEFRGARVPDVLCSGHHAEVAAWRRARALERTRSRRPDLSGAPDVAHGEKPRP
ncbi:MAG: tRNA (guanosine(37)-N1)-methyltransferase TrmD [Polyangiaceae bacterium]|nr:tRNA (guanosine(37)-N1)-methyltransferase TrmD [Polyangiaceae bacterium]